MTIETRTPEETFELGKKIGEKALPGQVYTLTGDLGLDSMLMVTMLIEFETSFNIEFDEVDMNPFELETVSDAVELVVRYVGED